MYTPEIESEREGERERHLQRQTDRQADRDKEHRYKDRPLEVRTKTAEQEDHVATAVSVTRPRAVTKVAKHKR